MGEEADSRDHIIDEVYESPEQILDGLSVADDVNPVSYYGFKDQNEFVNYIFDVLALDDGDVDRVMSEFEEAKCPYCEILEENQDPRLSYVDREAEDEAPYQPNVDAKVHDVRDLYCDTHFDAWITWVRTEKMEE